MTNIETCQFATWWGGLFLFRLLLLLFLLFSLVSSRLVVSRRSASFLPAFLFVLDLFEQPLVHPDLPFLSGLKSLSLPSPKVSLPFYSDPSGEHKFEAPGWLLVRPSLPVSLLLSALSFPSLALPWQLVVPKILFVFKRGSAYLGGWFNFDLLLLGTLLRGRALSPPASGRHRHGAFLLAFFFFYLCHFLGLNRTEFEEEGSYEHTVTVDRLVLPVFLGGDGGGGGGGGGVGGRTGGSVNPGPIKLGSSRRQLAPSTPLHRHSVLSFGRKPASKGSVISSLSAMFWRATMKKLACRPSKVCLMVELGRQHLKRTV